MHFASIGNANDNSMALSGIRTASLFMDWAAEERWEEAVNFMQLHVPNDLRWKWNKIFSILLPPIKLSMLKLLDIQPTKGDIKLSSSPRRPQNAFLMDETFIGNHSSRHRSYRDWMSFHDDANFAVLRLSELTRISISARWGFCGFARLLMRHGRRRRRRNRRESIF